MNYLVSALNTVREAVYTPPTKSTFLQTGELTVEEFVKAGDYLVYKFRTWSWSPADPSKRNPHLPEDKQFLVTRHVPRVRKLDELLKGGWEGDEEDEEGEGFGEAKGSAGKVEGIKSVSDKGVVDDLTASEDDIPDMEDDDDDDEAVIRDDNKGTKGTKNGSSSITAAGRSSTRDPERTYTLYITYSNFYHTPRLYLSGYDGPTQMPLDPQAMMEDIVGDYKDKTVTIEEFPLLEGGVRMASVHPCKHASVMKLLLDRADAALKLRRRKQLDAEGKDSNGAGPSGDGWEEVLAQDADEEDGEEPAIRVDQYLVVFLKFVASVTPGIEHDYTMGL